MIRKVLGFFVLAVILLFAVHALAGSFGSMEGFVKDAATLQPISGALVKVVVGNGIQVLTSSNGYYVFMNTIPSGKYTVTAVASGYVKREIKGVIIGSGSIKVLNISMYKQ